jgi:serine phosphatase RsbU (regulator of sigma subunit)
MSGILKNSLLVCLSLFIIGFLDWITGTEIFFSLFYLLPLSWLALQKNTSWLVLFINSIFASFIWLIAELVLPHEYTSLFVLNWNAVFGLASFIFIPFLLFYLQKRQREQLLINNRIKNYKQQFEQQKVALNEKNTQLNDLNSELEMLASVASKTDNAVILMNKDATVEWVNDSFKRIYHIDLKEFNLKYSNNFFDFVSENDSMNSIIKQSILTKQTVVFESSRTSCDKIKVYYQTTLSPILNTDGNVERLIGITTDISKLKKAELDLQEQNAIINFKNQQITESIFYAQNIQAAILPSLNKLQNYFKDVFVFFKPRDIVSGDFYWFHEIENKTFLAVIDGAGQGVPGALMSIIGNSILNEIIVLNNINSPNNILEELNRKIIDTFPIKGNPNISQYSGMDISLCCIDKINKTISISIAHQDIYIVRDNKMEKIEGDNFSIGTDILKTGNKVFKDILIKIDQPLHVYLATDGFQDQLGGEDNNNYTQSRFSEFLLGIHQKTFTKQFNDIHSEFTQWKGDSTQTDDILIVGFYLEP